MKFFHLVTLSLVTLPVVVGGCNGNSSNSVDLSKPAEQLSNSVENAAKDAAPKIEKAVQNAVPVVKNAVQNAVPAAENAAPKIETAVNNAAQKAKQTFNDVTGTSPAAKIQTALQQSSDLKNCKFRVDQTSHGIALRGRVQTSHQKSVAQKIAAQNAGGAQIINQLQIKTG